MRSQFERFPDMFLPALDGAVAKIRLQGGGKSQGTHELQYLTRFFLKIRVISLEVCDQLRRQSCLFDLLAYAVFGITVRASENLEHHVEGTLPLHYDGPGRFVTDLPVPVIYESCDWYDCLGALQRAGRPYCLKPDIPHRVPQQGDDKYGKVGCEAVIFGSAHNFERLAPYLGI